MYANTWAAVHRGTTTTALGDPDDDDTTPVAGLERVPMAITETSRTTFDPATGERGTIRAGTGRAVAGTDVQQDDRLQDLLSGKWWIVREVNPVSRSPIGASALSFDLRAA